MAGLYWRSIYPETLTGTALKTLLQIQTPTNQRVRLLEMSFSTKGVVASDIPGLVDLLVQTTAGTMTPFNPTAEVSAAETIQTTGQRDATVEPTAGNIIGSWEVHPQAGGFILPLDILVPGGVRIGLRCLFAVSISVRAYLRGEE